MSGTSMDGVDAAVVEFGGGGPPRLLSFLSEPYPRALRERLLRFAEGGGGAREACLLDAAVGDRFAAAAVAALRPRGNAALRADFAGSHGQTVWHAPRRGARPTATLQIGDAARVAEALRCTVVHDFRRRDAAAGGEGAPLVPLADWILLRKRGVARAVQNLGGVGNVTVIAERRGDVFAFDTGPANLPVDAAVRHVTGGREGFDRDGRRAARGRVDGNLVRDLLRHPFLRRRPPRSTGREEFGAAFITAVLRRRPRLRGDDLVATMTRFSAEATAAAYRDFVLSRVALSDVLLSGGGARNPVLVGHLRALLAPLPVRPLADAGLPGEAREAVAFAVLARETLRGRPGNLPAATGARRGVVLGSVIP